MSSESIDVWDDPNGDSYHVVDRRPGLQGSYWLDVRTEEVHPGLLTRPDLIEHLRVLGYFDSPGGRATAIRHGWVTPEAPSTREALVQFGKTVAAAAVKEFAADPEKIDQLSPFQFEELVAELLRDLGYDVCLTPKTRDRGRDVLAYAKLAGQLNCLVLVECKKWRRDRTIEPAIVKQLLFTVRDQDRATHGMIVTTAQFTSGARALEKEYVWTLSLHDRADLQHWLRRYGSWSPSTHGGVWLPYTNAGENNP
jgi:HJR/Mrr/RecB family endonuclease